MKSETFYSTLPVYSSIEELVAADGLTQLPDDWWIVISDIVGSTRAVSAGDYRQVVTLGASTIIAVVNALDNDDIPFAFGGDGSVVSVPEGHLEKTLSALEALRVRAKVNMNLDLRCGAMRVEDLRLLGHETRVGRYRRSDYNDLAIFSGGGIGFADSVIKGYKKGDFRAPEENLNSSPQLDGLECRWEPVRSARGDFASLIVIPYASSRSGKLKVLEKVFKALEEVYTGGELFDPVQLPELRLSFARKHLQSEMLMRAEPNTRVGKLRYTGSLLLQILLGKLMMTFNHSHKGFNWGKYPEELIKNIDNRNFADIYAHVFPGSSKQHAILRERLDSLAEEGEIVYGMHISDHALFTCLITQYSGKHLHFLDGGEGGLTLAAQEMKQKIKGNE